MISSKRRQVRKYHIFPLEVFWYRMPQNRNCTICTADKIGEEQHPFFQLLKREHIECSRQFHNWQTIPIFSYLIKAALLITDAWSEDSHQHRNHKQAKQFGERIFEATHEILNKTTENEENLHENQPTVFTDEVHLRCRDTKPHYDINLFQPSDWSVLINLYI